MSDNKLSLHIGERNTVTMSSGFMDVQSGSTFELSLNKQSISALNGDLGNGGPAAIGVTRSASRTMGWNCQQAAGCEALSVKNTVWSQCYNPTHHA